LKQNSLDIITALYKYSLNFKRGTILEKEIDLYFEKLKSLVEYNDNPQGVKLFYDSLKSFSEDFVVQINEFFEKQATGIFTTKAGTIKKTTMRMLDLLKYYFVYLEQQNLTQEGFLLSLQKKGEKNG